MPLIWIKFLAARHPGESDRVTHEKCIRWCFIRFATHDDLELDFFDPHVRSPLKSGGESDDCRQDYSHRAKRKAEYGAVHNLPER